MRVRGPDVGVQSLHPRNTRPAYPLWRDESLRFEDLTPVIKADELIGMEKTT
jgi:hypothetical protein